jgi:hypothetical protein
MLSQGDEESSDNGGQAVAIDARAGDSHPRTGAAPAALKLDRRTFLGDHTAPHTAPRREGQVWSIKIHDFGKQWVEMSWGKAEAQPGKKGEKGGSRNRERNEIRARGRAKGEIRRKCLAIGADHLVTLTYRDNVEDRQRVLSDLERLRRALARAGKRMSFVGVLECQKRGAHSSAFGGAGIPRCSASTSLLVQNRWEGTRTSERQRASPWKFANQTRAVPVQVHHQGFPYHAP